MTFSAIVIVESWWGPKRAWRIGPRDSLRPATEKGEPSRPHGHAPAEQSWHVSLRSAADVEKVGISDLMRIGGPRSHVGRGMGTSLRWKLWCLVSIASGSGRRVPHATGHFPPSTGAQGCCLTERVTRTCEPVHASAPATKTRFGDRNRRAMVSTAHGPFSIPLLAGSSYYGPPSSVLR